MSYRNFGSPSSGQLSPRYHPHNGVSQVSLTANQVSRITGVAVKTGETIKGQSRINYMPYEKKIIQYQNRQYVERVPKTRRVVQYQQRRVVEQVPRQVITTDYYAVQSIKQYYKQIVPEKKIQMVPVQRKIKKVQYVPVQKQIIHYPQGQSDEVAKGQSRIVLQKQGVTVKPDAQFRPIDPRLIYQYSNQHQYNPVGYVQDGIKRNLSNAPTPYNGYTTQGYYTGPHAYNQQSRIYTQPQQYTQYHNTQLQQNSQNSLYSFNPQNSNHSRLIDNQTVYRTVQQLSSNQNPNNNRN